MSTCLQRLLWTFFISVASTATVLNTGSAEDRVQVQPTSVQLIKPGTVIGDAAPEGWTYLLFKNSSRIGAGDMDAATDSLKHLASFLSSAMVVTAEGVRFKDGSVKYSLIDVGYGLYTRVGQSDMVVSSSTYKQLGAPLGFLDSLALSQAESRITRLKVTARTSSMAIVDSPTTVVVEGKHRDLVVRHAIVLHPDTGKLATLVWFIDRPAGKSLSRVISDVDYLLPNSKVEVVLHLDKSLFTLGLVTERALALNQMMWGKTQLKVPTIAEPLVGLERFSPEQLVKLEAALREELK